MNLSFDVNNNLGHSRVAEIIQETKFPLLKYHWKRRRFSRCTFQPFCSRFDSGKPSTLLSVSFTEPVKFLSVFLRKKMCVREFENWSEKQYIWDFDGWNFYFENVYLRENIQRMIMPCGSLIFSREGNKFVNEIVSQEVDRARVDPPR